ncbi:MAG TPA: hypothetical protein DC054_08675 [Blastocatellia bacterium]|nr:hypothetical protein [Blastocatellia bacterium]
MLKSISFSIVSILILTFVSTPKSVGQDVGPVSPAARTSSTRELRTIADGLHSSISDLFVAVVRNAETYSALREMDPSLPSLDGGFFQSNTLIAAFLGERPTGGYSISIREEAGGFILAEKKPKPGSMVPQMITSPFTLVAIPQPGNRRFRLDIGEPWKESCRTYRVDRGRFTTLGLPADMTAEFAVEGDIEVIGRGKLMTFLFHVRESGRESGLIQGLAGTFSEVVTSETNLTINNLPAWGALNGHNRSQAIGFFSEGGRKLSLRFTSSPTNNLDVATGEGYVEATLQEPKRAESGTKSP